MSVKRAQFFLSRHYHHITVFGPQSATGDLSVFTLSVKRWALMLVVSTNKSLKVPGWLFRFECIYEQFWFRAES